MARLYIFYFLIVIFLFNVQISNAQQTWSSTISGSSVDFVFDVYEKSDGSFIIAGQTQSFSDPYADGYLAKLDSAGTLVWQKTYGELSISEGLQSVRPTSDGGYIAAGIGSGNPYNIYVVKVTGQGILSWQKKFTLGTDTLAWIFAVRQLQGGDYILAGWSQIPFLTGDGAGLTFRLDALTGNIVWQKRFEIDGGSPDVYSGLFDSLESTSDGGAIIAGRAGGVPDTGSFANLWIVKINSSGGMDWQKNYGNDLISFGGNPTSSVQIRVVSGGYALFGSDGGNGFWFLKLNTSGNILFHRLIIILIQVTLLGFSQWTKARMATIFCLELDIQFNREPMRQ